MAVSLIDAERLRRRRFAAQLLAAPARSPADVAGHMLGLQAQDLRAARLAVRARTAGLTAAEVNGALDRRAVVIGWLFRGTLHMVLPDDYPWLLGLTAPIQRRAVERRLEQLGYTAARADAAVGVLEKALADGPQTRAQLRRLLAARGFDAGGQVLVHLLVRSSLRGVSIRGPLSGGAQSFVLSRDWLGEAPAAELSGDERIDTAWRGRAQALMSLMNSGVATIRAIRHWLAVRRQHPSSRHDLAAVPGWSGGGGWRCHDLLPDRVSRQRRYKTHKTQMILLFDSGWSSVRETARRDAQLLLSKGRIVERFRIGFLATLSLFAFSGIGAENYQSAGTTPPVAPAPAPALGESFPAASPPKTASNWSAT